MNKDSMHVFLLVTVFGFLLCACEAPKPVQPNEKELITTIKWQFVASASNDTVTLLYKDMDGDGGDTPKITISKAFKTNQLYTGTITLLNESISPTAVISDEVLAEGDSHQFFYEEKPQGTSIFDGAYVFAYADQDKNKQPIGLMMKASTRSTPATSKLRLILRHQPDKSANLVSAGNVQNAGGETDIDVSFDIRSEN